jgi:iron complex outermembrane recepter protein
MSKTPPILINLAVILLTALFISPHASAAGETSRPFDIPRGDAADTLKLFAQQSSEQVVYPPRDVRGVRTNAVKGRFTPVDALRQMLRGTALSVLHDERTGALAIKRQNDPNAVRTAPNGLPGDRPQSNEATSRIQSATNDPTMITNKRPALHRVLGAVASLLISASALPAQSGSGAIVGRVFNPATSEYVRNAEVRIHGTELVTSTEQDGSFRFDRVPAGDVTLAVTYTGYKPVTETLHVSEGGIATREINLTRLVGGGSSDATIKLQEFVVSGDREGNAKAIMQQRNSMNITQSVASDVFGEILDGNIGEFIKYLPGVDVEAAETRAYLPRLGGLEPNFTGVAIDGVRIANADAQLTSANLENSAGTGEYERATGFDQVSLNSVESIEIATTLSADMDADAPAGRINLKTKRAFELKGRRITYQFGATLNSNEFTLAKTWGPQHRKEYLARPNYMLGYAESFLNNRLGVMLNVSSARTYDEYHRVTPTHNRTPVGADQRPIVMTQLVLKDGPNLRDRFATTFTADLKASPHLTMSVNVIYNDYQHSQDGSNTLVFNFGSNNTNANTGRQNVLGDGLTVLQTNGLAANTSRSVSVGSAPVFKETRNVSYAPKFEYRRGAFRITGTYGYSHGNSNYVSKERGHVTVNIPALRVDILATRPSPKSPEWTITQLSGPDWSDLANYRGNTAIASTGRTSKVDVHDGQLDGQYTLPFRIPSSVKIGGKLNDEARKSTDIRPYEVWNYLGPGGGSSGSWEAYPSGNPISMDIGSANWLVIDKMPPRRDSEAVGALFHAHPEYFVRTATADNYYSAFIANNRDFRQRIAAAYGMASARFGKAQLQGGMRWERSATYSKEWAPLKASEVVAAGFPVNPATSRATTVPGLDYQYFTQPRVTRRGEYDKWFPSVSAKFNIARHFNAHIGFNRAISRAPITALSGVWTVDEVNGVVRAPNPGLKPADSEKIVARLAYYFEPVGSFTLQVSQNKITNLRQSYTYTAEEFGYGNNPEWSAYDFILLPVF